MQIHPEQRPGEAEQDQRPAQADATSPTVDHVQAATPGQACGHGWGGTSGPSLPRLLRWLRLASGTPEAMEAAGLWAEAQALARPTTWRAKLARQEFLDRFHPYAQASSHLMRLLADCSQVWLLAATIGPALEERSAWYFAQGRGFAGYVLDRAGTALVEQTMRELRRACGPGLTRRYSPGYKEFPLEAQRPLLEALHLKPSLESRGQETPLETTGSEPALEVATPGLAGLRLTGGCMLQPGKSITAVAGVRVP